MALLRLRRQTCKIIIVTSLVWCVLDILILLSYSDCSAGLGWGCGGDTNQGKRGAIKFSKRIAVDAHGREVGTS